MKKITWVFAHCRMGMVIALLVLAGPARAQFGPVDTYGVGSGTTSSVEDVALGDVNGDGRLDVVTVSAYDNLVTVLLGRANPSFGWFFQVAVSYPTGANSGPGALALGDVNGDGRLDIVTANYLGNTVGVLPGQAGGSFGPVATYSTGAGSSPGSVALGDVNGDGRLDVVTGNYANHKVGVLLGQAAGGFAGVVAYASGAGGAPNDVALGDMNGDGRPDIVLANRNTSTVGVLLAQASGGFGAVTLTSINASPADPTHLTLGDVNADGRLDVVAVNGYTAVANVLLGQAGGGFAALSTYPTGSANGATAVALGDINGDGRLDMATANDFSSTAGVLLGLAGGGFGPPTTYAVSAGSASPGCIVVGDLNNDGRLDIVTGNNSTVALLLSIRPLATVSAAPGPPLAAVSVYPNPAGPAARVVLSLSHLPPTVRQVEVTLVTSLGQVVGQLTLAATQGSASGSVPSGGLPPGVYWLRLRASTTPDQPATPLPTQRLSLL